MQSFFMFVLLFKASYSLISTSPNSATVEWWSNLSNSDFTTIWQSRATIIRIKSFMYAPCPLRYYSNSKTLPVKTAILKTWLTIHLLRTLILQQVFIRLHVGWPTLDTQCQIRIHSCLWPKCRICYRMKDYISCRCRYTYSDTCW